MYEGACTCGEIYIGETDRIFEIRWHEYDTPADNNTHNLFPAKSVIKHLTHHFTWRIVTSDSQSILSCKILESYYIAKIKPKVLFRNGIT